MQHLNGLNVSFDSSTASRSAVADDANLMGARLLHAHPSVDAKQKKSKLLIH
jgi:hypothetical protein